MALFGCITRSRQHTGISFDDVEYCLAVTNNTILKYLAIEKLKNSYALYEINIFSVLSDGFFL